MAPVPSDARPILSIVVTGRNDDYGGGFTDRLFRAASHNLGRLTQLGLPVELVFVEWNPLPARPPLAEAVVERFPDARALVVSPECHAQYSRNRWMDFHEMPAKNVGLLRARGEWVLSTNADVLLDDALCEVVARGTRRPDTLYRAKRIDLASEVVWEDRDDPRVQLASGEGRGIPPPCLGAAGDFCLAHVDLWHRLRGYDERVRFSTRAKDWQFFLSAARRGVPIRFIGRVYHLDHEAGFQRADARERESARAHFGGPWDIEYGLPVENGPDWGLATCTLRPDPHRPRLTHVDAPAGWIPAEEDPRLMPALTADAPHAERDTGVLMHTMWQAFETGARVLADLDGDADLVRLSGLTEVASPLGVDVRSRHQPPAFDGHTTPRLRVWPARPAPRDLVLTRRTGHLEVQLFSTGRPLDVLPRRRRLGEPPFNRLLSRRLLRAWLELRRNGCRRLALYGAGSHTAALLQWGLPDWFDLVAIVVSRPGAAHAFDVPLVALDDVRARSADALLLSSVSYEPEMLAAARARGWAHVMTLYLDQPFRASPLPVAFEEIAG